MHMQLIRGEKMSKFMKSLNNISRSQQIFRAERLKADGICATHHTFILAICHNAGCSQEELSRELCLNKSTVARTLNYLEEKGYVRREANTQDKRSFLVYPTDKMCEIYPLVIDITRDWNKRLRENIPEKDLEAFFSVLSKMEQKAKALTSNREEI